jgi:hypothetical protein
MPPKRVLTLAAAHALLMTAPVQLVTDGARRELASARRPCVTSAQKGARTV